ncbi:hypothetical protein ASG92_24725 [Arthrobacter sp. Soil736]|nr:hypothetical protein ASG92_24725 [Arthrobacter sp. Soil736]
MRSPTRVLRYRVKSRSSRIGGGTNEGRTRPGSTSWAIHAESATFGFAAGHILHVRRVQRPHLRDPVLEQIEHRFPVHTRELHPRPGHPLGNQPGGVSVENVRVASSRSPWMSSAA